MRGGRLLLAIAVWTSARVVLAAPPPPDPQLFAIIVANNKSREPDRSDLQFADDDGARYYRLLSNAGEGARAVKRAHLGPFEHSPALSTGARGAALAAGRAAGLWTIDDAPRGVGAPQEVT